MSSNPIQLMTARVQYLIRQRAAELNTVQAKYNAAIAELNNMISQLGGQAVDVQSISAGNAPAPQIRRPRPEPPPEVRRLTDPGRPKGNGSPAKQPPRVATNPEILKARIKAGGG